MALPNTQYDKTQIIPRTLSWPIDGAQVTTQVPACGYTQILTSSSPPAFVTATSGGIINFESSPTSFSDQGLNTISVTSTLLGYDFTPQKIAPTYTA